MRKSLLGVLVIGLLVAAEDKKPEDPKGEVKGHLDRSIYGARWQEGAPRGDQRYGASNTQPSEA